MTISTAKEIAAAIKEDLPRYNRRSLYTRFMEAIGAGGFLLGAVEYFTHGNPSLESIEFLLLLFLLLIGAIVYIFFKENQGYDRYTQAIPHFHYIAHITRDAIRGSDKSYIDETCRSIIDSAATVFSIITGRACNVSLLELGTHVGGENIQTILKDSMGMKLNKGIMSASRNLISDYDLTHPEQYSSIKSLHVSRDKPRFYVSNDVYRDYKVNNYCHPMLYDPRTGVRINNLPRDEFPLDFRSTLVVPIRAVSGGDKYEVFGFLAVDCGSRNVFDIRLSPDLAGAYADLIYMLYKHSRFIGGTESVRVNEIAANPGIQSEE